MRKLVIVGYARESTKEQAVNGFNMDDQEKKIHPLRSQNRKQ